MFWIFFLFFSCIISYLRSRASISINIHRQYSSRGGTSNHLHYLLPSSLRCVSLRAPTTTFQANFFARQRRVHARRRTRKQTRAIFQQVCIVYLNLLFFFLPCRYSTHTTCARRVHARRNTTWPPLFTFYVTPAQVCLLARESAACRTQYAARTTHNTYRKAKQHAKQCMSCAESAEQPTQQ